MRTNDPFATFEGWEDTDAIKASVEEELARGAGVSVDRLRAALRRVVWDGYHGPVSDRDWKSISGRTMPMRRAIEIIRAAQGADLPTVQLQHPDHGYLCDGSDSCLHEDHDQLEDPGPMFHQDPVEIDRSQLIEWYFAELRPIYGSVYL